MAEFIGREIDFGIAVESERGTVESAATKWVRKTTCNIIPRTDRVTDDSSFGRLEDAERVRSVRKWNEGSLEGILHADVAGYFFLNLYGKVESETEDSGVYSHVFTLDQTILHPTLSLFVRDKDVRASKMALGVVSSLEITVATDNYVRYTAEFVGAQEQDDDESNAVSLDTEYDFVSRDVSLRLADTVNDLDSAGLIKAKNVTVTWNPNIIRDHVVGSYSPDNIYNGAFAIEGTFTRNYTDQLFENMYKTDEFKALQIVIEGEAEIGTSLHPKITITLNKVQVTDWTRSGGQNELVTEEVSFKAFYNPEDEAQSEVELVNTTPAYAVGS